MARAGKRRARKSKPRKTAPAASAPAFDTAPEAPKRAVRDGVETVHTPVLQFSAAPDIADVKRRRAVVARMRRAIKLMDTDVAEGARIALEAVAEVPDCPTANHIMAVALDRLGQYSKSLDFYERAWRHDPENGAIHHNIAMVAWKLDMLETAEKFYRLALHFRPGAADSTVNLSGVLRDLGRFDEAIELLRACIYAEPENPELWNALGTVLLDQGRPDEATTFYREALRVGPTFARAWNNLAYAAAMDGQNAEAAAALDTALDHAQRPSDRATMTYSRAMARMGVGDLVNGWKDYAVRLSPDYENGTIVLIDRPIWAETESPAGKNLMIVGEQGLGDEVLFLNAVDELIAEVGPEGRVTLAVEARLVDLVRRSFPGVEVGRHATIEREGRKIRGVPWVEGWSQYDAWAFVGTVAARYRRGVEDFPAQPFLTPDPDRVAAMRGALAAMGDGPKIGIVWKSLLMNVKRRKYFSPFQQWAPILKTPGATFVSLQYGDTAEEIAMAREIFGVDVHAVPDLDLKDDLDGVAALGAALDLSIGPMNASTNLAAAAGCPTWFITLAGHWPRLGTDRLPWYPGSRAFSPHAYGAWDGVMNDIAAALAAHVAEPAPVRAA